MQMSPELVRSRCRSGEFTEPTAGLAPGRAQANLVVLGQADAADFALFAKRNPKPCPVIEVTEPGSTEPVRSAPGPDLSTDLPRYRVFINGVVESEPLEVTSWWRPDLVSFLIGCSFTVEGAMTEAGLPLRHVEEGKNVPMYITNPPCVPAGEFSGELVVSMRPIPEDRVRDASEITAKFPGAHGAPIHTGDPGALGIGDLSRPDFGESVSVGQGEVPMFWACGVTPQMAILAAKPELAITHAPGHMFVTDLADDALSSQP